MVNTGNANNQIGIDCTGNVITALINGQSVLSTTDATYATGTSFIGAGASGDQVDGLTVGFDNLTVTDLGAAAQPTPIAQNPDRRCAHRSGSDRCRANRRRADRSGSHVWPSRRWQLQR